MDYYDAYQSFERKLARGEYDTPKKPGKSPKKNQPLTNETIPELKKTEPEQDKYTPNLKPLEAVPVIEQKPLAVESTPAIVESRDTVGKPVAQFKETIPAFVEPSHPKEEAKPVVQAVAPQAEESMVGIAEPAPEIQKVKNPELDLMVHKFVTEMGTDLITTFVAGTDGDIIAGESNDPNFNSKIAAASIPLILQLAARAGGKVGLGQVDNNMTSTDKVNIIARFIGDSSFCWGVVVLRNSPLGYIRMMMNEYANKIWATIQQLEKAKI